MSSQKWWRYRSEEIAPLSERPLVETLPKWLFLVGRNATAPSSPLFVVSSSQSPPNPSSAAWCTLLSAQLQVKPCLANTQCRLLASLPIKYETFFFSRTLLAPNRSSSVYPGLLHTVSDGYPIPKISDYSENISGRVRVLLKIIGSGRVSGTRLTLYVIDQDKH